MKIHNLKEDNKKTEIRICKKCGKKFKTESRWNNYISHFCNECGKTLGKFLSK